MLPLQVEFWQHARASWNERVNEERLEAVDCEDFFEYEAEAYMLIWKGIPPPQVWAFSNCFCVSMHYRFSI